MIVRISTEGQHELDRKDAATLASLDGQAVAVAEARAEFTGEGLIPG